MGDCLNFNITRRRDINNVYEVFKKEFLNPDNSISDLKENFDLSKREYDTLRLRVLNETGLKRKPSHRNNNIIVSDSTYIHRNGNGKYSIVKSIKGELHYFGQYDSLREAQTVRDCLIKNNWEKKGL